MKINEPIKSFVNVYNKMSNIGKLLIFVIVFLILITFFKYINKNSTTTFKEGYEQNDKFLFKKSSEVYDDFYADIYDHLVFNNMKDDFEVMAIMDQTGPTSKSVILDVGSGTGHHVAKLSKKDFNVIGIDISPSMIKKSKEKYPQCNFQVGNALNPQEFYHNTFTHILCLYFTIYYFNNKRKFFDNCMDWLMPGGFLIVHLVDRSRFDPILPPGNPLYIVSPQKYSKKRITSTKIHFNKFMYDSNFNMDETANIAKFEEKFKFDNGKTRKQEQVLYMEDLQEILTIAEQCGFLLQEKIDLVKCAYENQYLYVLVKPS